MKGIFILLATLFFTACSQLNEPMKYTSYDFKTADCLRKAHQPSVNSGKGNYSDLVLSEIRYNRCMQKRVKE